MRSAAKHASGSRRTVRKIAIGLVLLFALSYILLSPLFAMHIYRYLLFMPWKYPVGYFQAPLVNDLLPSEVWFDGPDGTRLNGWFYRSGNAVRTVIVHSGQGGNLTINKVWAKVFLDSGANVLLYDYEGYGKSTGEPSIEALQGDGLAACDFLVNTVKIPATQIVNFGASLGTGVASYVAGHRQTGALILFSPYTTLREAAQNLHPILRIYPDFLFPSRQLECLSCLTREHPPVLIVAGSLDPIVPVTLSDRVARLAVEPKSYLRMDGAGHVPVDVQSLASIGIFLGSLDTTGKL